MQLFLHSSQQQNLECKYRGEIIVLHKEKLDIFLYICPIIYLCVTIGEGFIAVSQCVVRGIISGSATPTTTISQ